jgi:hypothetical protein
LRLVFFHVDINQLSIKIHTSPSLRPCPGPSALHRRPGIIRRLLLPSPQRRRFIRLYSHDVAQRRHAPSTPVLQRRDDGRRGRTGDIDDHFDLLEVSRYVRVGPAAGRLELRCAEEDRQEEVSAGRE